MNILFLLRSLDIGGLEVVTATLANKFRKEGHHVCVFAFEKRSGKVRDRFDAKIPIIIGHCYKVTKSNVIQLRRYLQDKKIDVVINQWGLPLTPIKVLTKAKNRLNIKVISIYHNDPLRNGRIQSVSTEIIRSENDFKRCILRIKKFMFRCITGYAMGYVYRHSDIFEVLSPSFVEHFKQFTKLCNVSKLVVQTNPVTLNNDGYTYNPILKEKEIIYVGRIDYTQKRVHRIIEIWSHLEHRFPDWRLTIVGDGEERENIEIMAENLKLHNVVFEGFQPPRPYYERASLLVLASEFEGFPLVLAECMSFGVVPVVYGSYSAVYDIIEDEKDGIIVPITDEGFNAAVMADKCKRLMADGDRLNNMAFAAIEKSKNYSIDKIYEQWMRVMNKIISRNH